MANPVLDEIAALPPAPSWQNDASGADTNNPLDDDTAAVDTLTGLSPNLRSIKSNVRALSVNLGWINYTGLESAPSPDGPTQISDQIFTLDGDWTATNVALNLPIGAGQRVKFHFSDGTTAVGTLKLVELVGTLTRFTLVDASITGDLVTGYVEFSAAGPPFGATNDPLILEQDVTTFQPMVRPEQGGTGHSVASTDPTGDVVIGAAGFPAMKVTGFLESQPIDLLFPPDNVRTDQVMKWGEASEKWQAQALTDIVPQYTNNWGPFIISILTAAQTRAASGSMTLGGVTVKWATAGPFTIANPVQDQGGANLLWDTPFIQQTYAVVGIASNLSGTGSVRVWITWDDVPGNLNLNGANFSAHRDATAAGTGDTTYYVTAIGIGTDAP